MRELSGALGISAILQIVIGCSGLVGLMLNYIGPLTIAPAITMIGISIFDTAGDYSAQNWGISVLWVSSIHYPGILHYNDLLLEL